MAVTPRGSLFRRTALEPREVPTRDRRCLCLGHQSVEGSARRVHGAESRMRISQHLTSAHRILTFAIGSGVSSSGVETTSLSHTIAVINGRANLVRQTIVVGSIRY